MTQWPVVASLGSEGGGGSGLCVAQYHGRLIVGTPLPGHSAPDGG